LWEAAIEQELELVPIGKKATDAYLEEQMKSLIRNEDGQYAPRSCRSSLSSLEPASPLSFFASAYKLLIRFESFLSVSSSPCLLSLFLVLQLIRSFSSDFAYLYFTSRLPVSILAHVS
jgi:hypothetical protein